MRGNAEGSVDIVFEFISILASAWEATKQFWAVTTSIDISILASAWEATRSSSICKARVLISILASAWEATFSAVLYTPSPTFQFSPLHERQRHTSCKALAYELFQFSPLHERQQSGQCALSPSILFQFSPLHERQPDAIETFPCNFYFNSRLCMRGNVSGGVPNSRYHVISILASAWEATLLQLYPIAVDNAISILASAWEATFCCPGLSIRTIISILASAWEATFPS